MNVKAQPDDHSTATTRAVGNITGWLGSFPAITISLAAIVAWAIGGFFVAGGFGNNTYQLLINTGTTIITFLMVFIIQNTQKREGRAIQTKLDAQSEVLRLVAERLNIDDDEDLLTRIIGVEDAPEHVIKTNQDRVRKVAVESGRHGLARGPATNGTAKDRRV